MSRTLFEELRILPAALIGATFTAIGTPLEHAANQIKIDNNTNGDMIVTTDTSKTNGEIFLAKGTFFLDDSQINKGPNRGSNKYAAKTQFYVKYVTAPTEGSMYIFSKYNL